MRRGNRLQPLSGLDSLFLHLETPETPMHVATLHRLELPDGYGGDYHADLKGQVARRLHLAPLFHRRLHTLPLAMANPFWVEDAEVDLDYHVRRVRLPCPGTQAQLEACAARIHSTLMDRSRPLWEVHVVEGLQTGEVGLYTRVHHAVLDGAAGMALAGVLLDPTPLSRELPRPVRSRRAGAGAPGIAELARAVLLHDAEQYSRFLRHLPDLVLLLTGMVKRPVDAAAAPARPSRAFGPRTPLNVSITGERSFAAVSLSLEEAKRVARAHGAKLNDVVLAICSGALRSHLAGHGGIPRQPLVAGMPLSLRESGNTEYSTQATMTLVNLATDIADPVQRLLAIRDAAGAIKAVAGRANSVIPTDAPSLGAPWLLGGLAALYGRSRLADRLPPIMNVVISNVPGPAAPLYAAGARMRSCWPLSIVEHGLGLNITVVSYCGSLDFGLVAARCAIPDLHPLARSLAAAHAELLDLTAHQAGQGSPQRGRVHVRRNAPARTAG